MLSPVLESRPCPRCTGPLSPGEPGTYAIQPAGSFAECLRRCEVCGIGFSNSSTVGRETIIYRNPRDNVPTEMQEGFLEAIRLGVSKFNLANKETKAGFSSSEDALTWTVFRWLQQSGQIRKTLSVLGIDIAKRAAKEPVLLLWGSQVPNPPVPESKLGSILAEISVDLEEVVDRRTEPDVVLDFGDAGVVFIEVKFGSGNEIKDSDYSNWDRYLNRPAPPAFRDSKAIRQNGQYELARNWRFAWEVSKKLNVPVGVVNLGPESLFKGRSAESLDVFVSLLNQDPRHQFYRVTWQHLFEASGELPPWFPTYAVDKRLEECGCYAPAAKAA